jgi:hypothetical protein
VDPQGGEEGGLPAAHCTVFFYYLKRKEEKKSNQVIFI